VDSLNDDDIAGKKIVISTSLVIVRCNAAENVELASVDEIESVNVNVKQDEDDVHEVAHHDAEEGFYSLLDRVLVDL